MDLFDKQMKILIEIFGGIDALELRSCMTLFSEVLEDDLFEKVL